MTGGDGRRAARENAHALRVIIARATIGGIERLQLRQVASMLDAGETDPRQLRENARTLRSVSARRTVKHSDGDDLLQVAANLNELALELGK